MNHISVAIDGPAGAGKSSIARKTAEALDFVYVDTGAIYRTVGHAVLSAGLDPDQAQQVAQLLPSLRVKLDWIGGVQHMFLNGVDVTDHIRTPEVSSAASRVSAVPAVRDFLLETQRATAREHNVIMDGRDIATVVLPNADVKIFLSASAEVRARRRFRELQEAGKDQSYEDVLKDMQERDARDTNRAIAPLRPAEDSIRFDTSDLTLEQSVASVIEIIRKKLNL